MGILKTRYKRNKFGTVLEEDSLPSTWAEPRPEQSSWFEYSNRFGAVNKNKNLCDKATEEERMPSIRTANVSEDE